MLCEPDQPFVAHPVKELTDVGIQYPVYVAYPALRPVRPVHRAGFARVRTRMENPIKSFSDCVQDFLTSAYWTILVLQRGDAERALFSIRFWDVVTLCRAAPCAALM